MMMKRHHNPAFGDWDRWDDQRMSVRPAHHQHHQRKVKRGGEKQGRRVCDVAAQTTARGGRAPKAVDEDLYKIPPELLHQKPERVSQLPFFFWLVFFCDSLPKLSECCVLTLIAEDAAVELGVRMHGAQLHCLTKRERERERERGCRSNVVRVKK
ncbi:hypothetical protein GW17_00015066 [Ensete ventricosum]|nr:hypothetical protein GW17_00015066 [Ensete ventricosum]